MGVVSQCFLHVVLVLAAVGSRFSCLYADFTYDDERVVQSNPIALQQAAWSEAWNLDYWGSPIESPYSHGSFRPITSASFAASSWLSGAPAGTVAEAWQYRAVSFLLHALNTILVFHCLSAWVRGAHATASTSSPWPMLAGALLFAVHTAGTEAVCSIASRADLLAATFTLLAVLAQTYEVGVVQVLLLCTGASLCKETGVAAFFACAVLSVLTSRKDAANSSRFGGAYVRLAGAALFVAARVHRQGWRTPVFSAMENSLVGTSGVPRVLTTAYLFARHLAMLLAPWPQSHDWSNFSVKPITSASDPRNALSVFVLLVVAAFVLRAARASDNKAAVIDATAVATSSTPAVDANSNIMLTNLTPSQPKTRGRTGRSTAARARSSSSRSGSPDTGLPVLAATPALTLQLAGGSDNQASACSTPPQGATTAAAAVNYAWLPLFLVLLPLLPASNIVMLVGFTLAERIVYAPLIGLCLLFAQLLARFERRVWVSRIATVLVLGACAYLNSVRGAAWMNDTALWRAELAVNPCNSKAWYSLGRIAEEKGEWSAAEEHYNTALQCMPTQAEYPHLSLSDVLYPDAVVHLANIALTAQEEPAKAFQILWDTTQRLEYVRAAPTASPTGDTGCYPTPTSVDINALSAAVGVVSGTTEACGLGGGVEQLHPSLRSHHDRITMYAVMTLNTAILGRQLGVLTPQDVQTLLLRAAGGLAAIPPHRRVPELAARFAEQAELADMDGLASRWYALAAEWMYAKLDATGSAAAGVSGGAPTATGILRTVVSAVTAPWEARTSDGRTLGESEVSRFYAYKPRKSTSVCTSNVADAVAVYCSEEEETSTGACAAVLAAIGVGNDAAMVGVPELLAQHNASGVFDAGGFVVALEGACKQLWATAAEWRNSPATSSGHLSVSHCFLVNDAQSAVANATTTHAQLEDGGAPEAVSGVSGFASSGANAAEVEVLYGRLISSAVHSARTAVRSLKQALVGHPIRDECTAVYRHANARASAQLPTTVCIAPTLLRGDMLAGSSSDAASGSGGISGGCSGADSPPSRLIGSFGYAYAADAVHPRLVSFQAAIQRLTHASLLLEQLHSHIQPASLRAHTAALTSSWAWVGAACYAEYETDSAGSLVHSE